MIKEGKVEDARVALNRFNEYADSLEKEIDPSKQEEAKRVAAAIRNAIREIESQIPENDKNEFVDDVIERSENIRTAAEIAGKIKELCEQLSKLDPGEYDRVCKTGDDSPRWQKKLHRELTAEQEKEARAFFEIMSQCFQTSGRECRCKEISISAFADKCSVVAPLAASCDEGNENACEEMEEQTENMDELLPDYLQDVMRSVEERFGEAQFDLHMPKECQDAGAKTPKECMKIMIKTHAPEECVAELEKRNIQNEREARAICEEIMFKLNAPEECVTAGLKDPKECGKLMFRTNAPQECIDAGLTGDNRGDEKKCREIMESLGGNREGPGPGGFGGNCRGIENSEERLKCYDSASQGAGEHYEKRGPPGGWPPQCQEKGATTRESCEKVMREWGESQRGNFERRDEFREERREFGPPPECEGLSPEECRSKFEGQRPPEGFVPPPEGQIPPEGQLPPEQQTQPTTEQQQTTTTTTQTETQTETTSGSSGSGVTGSVVFNQEYSSNKFIDYFFR